MTDRIDEPRTAPACTRCGERKLRHVMSIPKPFDQPTAFTILRCEACGHVEWQPQPQTPPPLPSARDER